MSSRVCGLHRNNPFLGLLEISRPVSYYFWSYNDYIINDLNAKDSLDQGDELIVVGLHLGRVGTERIAVEEVAKLLASAANFTATAFTLEVPMSIPTIISPIAKTNSSVLFLKFIRYKNITF